MSENQSDTSERFLELATRKELSSINDFLAPLGLENDVDVTITKDQLSRKVAEEVQRREISEAMTRNSTMVVAAAVRLAHEANRARRDITISVAPHKKLMLSVYRTMYQRKLKLEKKIQEGGYA